MKKIILLWLFSLMGVVVPSYGQKEPCQEVNLADDPIKKSILREFIDEAVGNNDFRDDKGVVRLTVYQDKQGLTRWILSLSVTV